MLDISPFGGLLNWEDLTFDPDTDICSEAIRVLDCSSYVVIPEHDHKEQRFK